jgi:phage FluMu gp28-like protein
MSSGVYLPRALVERCQDKSIPRSPSSRSRSSCSTTSACGTEQWIADNLKPLIDAMPGLRTVSARTSAATATSRRSTCCSSTRPPLEDRFASSSCGASRSTARRIRDFILDNVPLFHHAKFDARGNGQSHAEGALQRYGGARIECVMATQQWYAENMPHYKAALEAKTSILPGGEDVIADHRRGVMDKGKPKIDDGKDKGATASGATATTWSRASWPRPPRASRVSPRRRIDRPDLSPSGRASGGAGPVGGFPTARVGPSYPGRMRQPPALELYKALKGLPGRQRGFLMMRPPTFSRLFG